MNNRKINVLGISGSLRSGSSASAVLRLAGGLFPEQVDFKIYDGIGKIPAFDDSNQIPAEGTEFIDQIVAADAVFFCIPEYAFGVPGALKNALDWTVASTAFSDKPVALITAASGGDKAHASLALTLTALGTKIKEGTKLLIPFIRTKLSEKGEIKDPEVLISIKEVTQALLQTVDSVHLINS
jgi:NAD(P)H-dependent FMN reductase